MFWWSDFKLFEAINAIEISSMFPESGELYHCAIAIGHIGGLDWPSETYEGSKVDPHLELTLGVNKKVLTELRDEVRKAGEEIEITLLVGVHVFQMEKEPDAPKPLIYQIMKWAEWSQPNHFQMNELEMCRAYLSSISIRSPGKGVTKTLDGMNEGDTTSADLDDAADQWEEQKEKNFIRTAEEKSKHDWWKIALWVIAAIVIWMLVF